MPLNLTAHQGSMAESATQMQWADQIVKRAKVFGIVITS